MQFREAFVKTLKVFKIRNVYIARRSGLLQGEVCNYKNGKKDLLASNLYRLVSALPPEAKAYFYMLCSSEEVEENLEEKVYK